MSGTAILVLARLDSSRLPGKALRDLGGRPLLGRVLDRVRRVPGGPRVVVATSERPMDDAIADFAAVEGVDVFRGPVDDLASRCLLCAERLGLEGVVRISGDSPFIDPDVVAAVMARAAAPDAPELTTNLFPRGWPPGVSAEVVTTECLRRILAWTSDPEDREHVTRYAYRNPERFRLANVSASKDYGGVSLTVDTPDDLEKAIWIVSQFDDSASAELDAVVALARRWPLSSASRSASESPAHQLFG